MLNKMFDFQNPFWRWVSNIPHMVALSVLWVVCSLPVVTVIPATVALYATTVRHMRPDIKGIYRCYFKTFKEELKPGILLSVLWLLVGLLFFGAYCLLAMISDASQLWAAIMLSYPLLWIPVVMVFVWMIGIQARFKCGCWKLHQNAIAFAFMNKLKSLLIIAITVACVVAARFFFMILLVLPSLIIVFWSLFMESEFVAYFPKQ